MPSFVAVGRILFVVAVDLAPECERVAFVEALDFEALCEGDEEVLAEQLPILSADIFE